MKNEEEKKYVHNGKTIKIIPAKRVKKTTAETSGEGDEKSKPASVKKTKKVSEEKGPAKYAVGDKVSLKTIPSQYSGAGFAQSVVTKVFKSTLDELYRYSIRSASGQELPLLPAEDLKPRK